MSHVVVVACAIVRARVSFLGFIRALLAMALLAACGVEPDIEPEPEASTSQLGDGPTGVGAQSSASQPSTSQPSAGPTGVGAVDLYAVLKSATGSHQTELHALAGTTLFDRFSLQTATALPETGPNIEFHLGDVDGDGKPDLAAVYRWGTKSNMVELHVLSAASNFQEFIVHATLPLHQGVGQNIRFAMLDWDRDGRADAAYLITDASGSGMTEVHVLSAASNYVTFVAHIETRMGTCNDACDFTFVDWDHDGTPDLAVLMRSGTGSHSTEVHVLSGASGFTNFLLHSASAVDEMPDRAQIALDLVDWDGDGAADLVYVQKNRSGSHMLEVHAVSGADRGDGMFRTYVLHTKTSLGEVEDGVEVLLWGQPPAFHVRAALAPSLRIDCSPLGVCASLPTRTAHPNGAYAYAPADIDEGGVTHLFTCSSGTVEGSMDHVRYINDRDGVFADVLAPTGFAGDGSDLAGCDPEVVRFGGFYYLFYGSTLALNPQEPDRNRWERINTVHLARATTIGGPYQILGSDGAWSGSPAESRHVIPPRVLSMGRTQSNGYLGASWPSLVVRGDKLLVWYSDDTDVDRNAGPLTHPYYFLEADDPSNLDVASARRTDIGDDVHSGEAKLDPLTGSYVMFSVYGAHEAAAWLGTRWSRDGVHWSPAEKVTDLPPYSHNVGVESDAEGHLPSGDFRFNFAAPIGLIEDRSWGAWSLYYGVLTRR